MSFIVIFEILVRFVNPLSANNKYYLHNRENLQQLIQIKLSQKLKIFSGFFAASYFEKEYEPHSLCISKIINSGRRGYLNV